MKSILFVYATQKEKIACKSLYHFGRHECVGKGPTQSAIRLGKLLGEIKPDFLINIGVCAMAQKNNTASLISVQRSIHRESKKECISPEEFTIGVSASIICSEKVFYKKEDMLEEFYGDMESYAIMKSCETWGIPYLVLKVPYDEVGVETLSFDHEVACKHMIKELPNEETLKKLFQNKITYPDTNYLPYLNFKLSFSQERQFEKMLRSYKSLSGLSEDDMKSLCCKQENKKDFLKFLQNTISSYRNI